ncbi:DUF5626 family protein [Enterococcus gilvus]|uniref:DUF5626 family protein n=1 Tax=Enterococcus gilvus TaxID=160453 RepID=UPI003D6ACE84
MKKIGKVFFVLGIFFIFAKAEQVSADEIVPEVSYDLLEGGTQTFSVETENGLEEIEISPDTTSEGNNRFAPYAIRTGTYNVSYTSPGAWRASYKVAISGGRISNVHSASSSPITGSITSRRLVKNSSVEARYYLTWKKQSTYVNCGVRSTVSGNNLNVSRF